jgi:hypothetical protein
MSDTPSQLGIEAVRRMSPERVAEAMRDGRLNALLSGIDPEPVQLDEPEPPEQVTVEQVRRMSPAEVMQAHKEGGLDGLLGVER